MPPCLAVPRPHSGSRQKTEEEGAKKREGEIKKKGQAGDRERRGRMGVLVLVLDLTGLRESILRREGLLPMVRSRHYVDADGGVVAKRCDA